MVKPAAAGKGESAEKLVKEWLDKRQKNRGGFAYHRMPDAKAARGPLAAQPADFIIACTAAGGTFLEVKECAEQYRLPKANIAQFGKLLAFHLAGMPSFVLVRCSAINLWVMFDSDTLMRQEHRELKSFPWAMGHMSSTHDEALRALLGD
jgi:hypothetical protein